MKIKLSYLYVALILFTLVSCAKEEITTATIDLRENVIGQYNFNIKISFEAINFQCLI
jgi:hypothetical protein